MKFLSRPFLFTLILSAAFTALDAAAQQAAVTARTDASQITVGDQVKLFIEASHDAKQGRLVWAVIPDTFNSLEVVEKGKIDTTKNGDVLTYKQRLLITGFDSGSYTIPAFIFSVVPAAGTPYTIQTDSFSLLVQTLPVDTTKPFRGIKDIIAVKSTWRDYILLILGGLLFLGLATFAVIYFIRNKKTPVPVAIPKAPVESLQDRTLRLLRELEGEKLWQSDHIKEYYVRLTDILRGYIETRFNTPAMELTTGELLQKAGRHPDMSIHYEKLSFILNTADLAKFAKGQPLPREHADSMEFTREFVMNTKPVVKETSPQQS